jgi:hypothetical protein
MAFALPVTYQGDVELNNASGKNVTIKVVTEVGTYEGIFSDTYTINAVGNPGENATFYYWNHVVDTQVQPLPSSIVDKDLSYVCVPNSCAGSTPVGQTCDDGCGGVQSGTYTAPSSSSSGGGSGSRSSSGSSSSSIKLNESCSNPEQVCGEWKECSNGRQTRECTSNCETFTDLKSCKVAAGSNIEPPVEEKEPEVIDEIIPEEKSKTIYLYYFLIIIAILTMIIIASIFIKGYKKNKEKGE